MKNFDNKLRSNRSKKLLGIGAVAIASTLASLSAAEDSGKQISMETTIKISLPSPDGLFIDENGNFDEKGVEATFDKLNYKEKAPLVWKIYKDAKKNGFSKKHTDQLLELFPQDKTVEGGIRKCLDEADVKNYAVTNLTGCTAATFLFFFSAVYLLGRFVGGTKSEASKVAASMAGVMASVPAALTATVAMITLMTPDKFESTIKSPDKMKAAVVQAQAIAYNQYIASSKEKLLHHTDEIVKKAIAKEGKTH